MPSGTSTPSLVILATYQMHPEDADNFKHIAERMAKDATQREGNTFLHVSQDVSSPVIFRLTEGWASQQALDDHLASEGFKSITAEALQLRIEHRTSTVYEVGHSSDLGLPG